MNSNVPDTIGGRISELRSQRKWTQKRLAEEANISVTFLSEIENDKRTMSFDVMLRLANALGTSLDYLGKGESKFSPKRRSLKIPPELVDAAEECGWSLGKTKDLLSMHRIVVARRNQDRNTLNPDKEITKIEWIEFQKKVFSEEL